MALEPVGSEAMAQADIKLFLRLYAAIAEAIKHDDMTLCRVIGVLSVLKHSMNCNISIGLEADAPYFVRSDSVVCASDRED